MGDWKWATEHGRPGSATTEQLVEWLGRRQLAAHTLVWRPGWGEWLPALQVAELAEAFPDVTPGSRRVARSASRDASAPPVPVEQYPRLRLLARDVLGRAVEVAGAGPRGVEPAPLGRRGFHDVDRLQRDLVTSQVPAAAMLEAARDMRADAERGSGHAPPAPSLRFGGVQGALAASSPAARGGGGEVQPSDAATSGRPLRDGLPARWPESPVAPSSPPPPAVRTLVPLAVDLGFPALLDSRAPKRRSGLRWALWAGLGAMACCALGVAASWSWSRWQHGPALDEPPAALRPVSLPVPDAPKLDRQRVTGACRVARPAVRLDDRALHDVLPSMAGLSTSASLSNSASRHAPPVAPGRVAVAYARNAQTLVGVTVHPDSLELQRLVVRRSGRSIVSVSPAVRDARLSFHAEREGGAVDYGRLLGAGASFRIGLDERTLIFAPLGQPGRRLWQLPTAAISVPSVAPYPGGFTVATRLGFEPGPLRVGVVADSGRPLSKLLQIGDSGARFGRPALATGEDTTALAVAVRSRDGARQSIWLARSPAGAPPSVLQPFEPDSGEPVGGGRSELDAPAIAALPGGGFALLYTQGLDWQRRVRLRRLSPSLNPLGASVDVAEPDGAAAGSRVGGLYWAGGRLLASYFRAHDEGFSLWVSSIACELGSE